MASERERYLKQQIELGGGEIYLSTEYRVPGTEYSSPAENALAEPLAPDLGAEPKAGKPSVPGTRYSVLPEESSGPAPTTSPKWKKDLPPIPGPGLVIEPPAMDLMGDEISRLESLDAVAAMVKGCRKCPLCSGRTNTVPGEGNPSARLMCIGEGPGATEDATGRPFVGQAGELLNGILGSIGLPREQVYIANIVKCRPPQNRKPLPDEAAACMPYLRRQIALIQPKVILALGGTAAEALLNTKRGLGDLRNQVHRYAGVPLIVTYHPAALLRNPNWKKPTWDDVRIARQLLGD
ncbi:MAG TPA: uracil-DNA glycosylase family protein [Gemmatimonadales bacterium]